MNNNIDQIDQAEIHANNLRELFQIGSIISDNISQTARPFHLLMFRTVAAAGLRRWAPDVLRASPDSMYNLLHEHLALSTFEQVSNAYGYSHIGHDMSLVKDFPLMRKLYRNFVFSFMRDRAKNGG